MSDPHEILENAIADLVRLNLESKYGVGYPRMEENSEERMVTDDAEAFRLKIQHMTTHFTESPMVTDSSEYKDRITGLLATATDLYTKMERLYVKYRKTTSGKGKNGPTSMLRLPGSTITSHLDELEEGEIPEEPAKRKAVIEEETRMLLKRINSFQSQAASKADIVDFNRMTDIQWDQKYLLCTSEACLEAVGPFLRESAQRRVVDLLDKTREEIKLGLATFRRDLEGEIQDRLQLTSLLGEHPVEGTSQGF